MVFCCCFFFPSAEDTQANCRHTLLFHFHLLFLFCTKENKNLWVYVHIFFLHQHHTKQEAKKMVYRN